MTPARRTAGLLALLLLLGLPSAPRAADALEVTLEVINSFTYTGDPLLVRVAVFNTGTADIEDSSKIDLVGGLKLASSTAGGIKLEGKKPDARKQPAVLPPGGFFGKIHDIAGMTGKKLPPGDYTISWEGAGMKAAPLTVKVIPKYDADAAYQAVMETEYGNLVFDLNSSEAPRHVQNFYDLAQQGFYDNTILYQVIKGVEIRGGDPSGTGSGWPGYVLESEISTDSKHSRGTLSMMKMAENQDNGSQFVITLSEAPYYDGKLTIFGQMKEGAEVLHALENIPTTGQVDSPFYRPLKPVTLRSVKVRKAGEKSGL